MLEHPARAAEILTECLIIAFSRPNENCESLARVQLMCYGFAHAFFRANAGIVLKA